MQRYRNNMPALNEAIASETASLRSPNPTAARIARERLEVLEAVKKELTRRIAGE
jgi:hypothetical protein